MPQLDGYMTRDALHAGRQSAAAGKAAPAAGQVAGQQFMQVFKDLPRGVTSREDLESLSVLLFVELHGVTKTPPAADADPVPARFAPHPLATELRRVRRMQWDAPRVVAPSARTCRAQRALAVARQPGELH